jgi:hypothetical protein
MATSIRNPILIAVVGLFACVCRARKTAGSELVLRI